MTISGGDELPGIYVRSFFQDKKRQFYRACAQEYVKWGGLPESFDYKDKRTYIQSVYDKVLSREYHCQK